jgi:hypothetical protein
MILCLNTGTCMILCCSSTDKPECESLSSLYICQLVL